MSAWHGVFVPTLFAICTVKLKYWIVVYMERFINMISGLFVEAKTSSYVMGTNWHIIRSWSFSHIKISSIKTQFIWCVWAAMITMFITRVSKVIMFSPCVFVCLFVSLSPCLSGRFNYEGLVPHEQYFAGTLLGMSSCASYVSRTK